MVSSWAFELPFWLSSSCENRVDRDSGSVCLGQQRGRGLWELLAWDGTPRGHTAGHSSGTSLLDGPRGFIGAENRAS